MVIECPDPGTCHEIAMIQRQFLVVMIEVTVGIIAGAMTLHTAIDAWRAYRG